MYKITDPRYQEPVFRYEVPESRNKVLGFVLCFEATRYEETIAMIPVTRNQLSSIKSVVPGTTIQSTILSTKRRTPRRGRFPQPAGGVPLGTAGTQYLGWLHPGSARGGEVRGESQEGGAEWR